MVDQAAPEAVKLPDPNDPRYAAARAKMANLFFAIGREDSRNGYGAMADDLMCGDLMQVPTWIALGMLAEAASLPCKSGEGAEAVADAVASALAKYAVAYTHVTLTDMSTAGRSWKVHETGHGNPFDHGIWLGEFDTKEAANAFCADLRRSAAIEAARAALTPDATQAREAELVAACEAYVEAYDAGTGTIHVNKQIRAALNARGGA